MCQSAILAPAKQCRGPCGRVKLLTEFRLDAAYRDGRRNRCRACYNAAVRAAERERSRTRAAAKPGASSARNRRYRARLRTAVLAHYGTACACCGTTKLLGIDHVHGDGAKHRRELFEGRGGARFYAWLIAQGFPEGYQTLCQPCNASKRTGRRCRLDHSASPPVTECADITGGESAGPPHGE